MSEPDEFREGECDLCGATAVTVVADFDTGRAMRSDRVTVRRGLRKLSCRVCGLVRDGHAHSAEGMAAVYGHDYTTAAPDYAFMTPSGPIPRSRMFRDWMISAFGEVRWSGVGRCLEVGSGAGALLAQFAERFPEWEFEGVELGQAEAAEARRRGLRVTTGSPDSCESGIFDAVVCVAVLEHVPSPTRFLATLRDRLRPGGLLFLAQPTQDVPSYDIFFVDHLHHFGSAHVEAYGRKCGFQSLGGVVGHEWMPNFSAHLWSHDGSPSAFAWDGPPAVTSCTHTVERVTRDLAALNATLARLSSAGRRTAVFGLNEVYALLRAYSNLDRHPIHCGLADRPEDPIHAGLRFPVVAPETCPAMGVTDVILAVNKVYYPQLHRRLAPLGVEIHSILS